MSQKSPPKPTGAELELLQVLWNQGPLTVREIHESLSGEKETGYTTTLKILQKMTVKGLVRRDEAQRSHIYHPVLQADQTRRQLVRDLLQRAFGGSPGKLMIAALSGKKATAAERAEIRRLLDEMETEAATEADSKTETTQPCGQP
ncbi:MAG: BlaI/MecI/CopY family transcriptional regulator [Verrucomicrobiaceae bacterium]|nr:MAG: BlaI/MecI/CopY family transcriptional regulator [Verrucomicrobiaceae bacterium]